jgi:hypothetical protein
MSTVEEIESAIENLKEDEFLRLAKWLEAKVADSWDRRMSQDSKDGKLDFLFNEAEHERAAGELNPWPATR